MVLVYVSALISLLLVLILSVPYIDFLKRHFCGQYIYEDAPKSHAHKAGTPTMGGVIIVDCVLVAAILSLLMFESFSMKSVIVLVSFLLFAIAGFIDDYKKLAKKTNKGLRAKSKLFIQFLAALIPGVYMLITHQSDVSVFGLFHFDWGYFYLLFALFVIIGSSNAINLTDGLDGLAAGLSGIGFLGLTIMLAMQEDVELAIISAAISFACFAFLYFNHNPAKVFMGDTGSLALGGVFGVLGVAGKLEFWLIPLGIVFILETLSVIIQVISFKTTGKRVFKMSPIHHHFELCGWSEKKVVYVFYIIGLIFATAGVIWYIL